jgi:transcriptional regulator with PAS, ATPase and Fis domain
VEETQPQSEQHRSTLAVDRFRLREVGGTGANAVFESSGTRVVIGTHERCDWVLRDRTISKFHCEITIDDRGVSIRDLGSKNGTLVQGVPIVEARLVQQALITLGSTQLRFELDEERVAVPASPSDRFGDLVGGSFAMRRIYRLLERASASDVTVLLNGETGTGKDVAAQAIHDQSARSAAPFVVVDCSAIHANLLETELFGHEKGAFTGATTSHEGCFEAAHGGTVFLDEIGELSVDLQPKLLRVLEKHEVRRVGSTRSTPVNVRVIAATNRDLRQEVNSKRFRADLYYRLAVVAVTLPPLRERLEDIPLLVERFLELRGLASSAEARAVRTRTAAAQAAMLSWPGNVRELRNYVERAIALRDEPTDDDEGSAPAVSDAEINLALPLVEARDLAIRSFEAKYLRAMLARHGSVTAAAKAAGVDRTHFHRLVRKSRESG